MSEVIDLQEALLAEHHHSGSALAACIVVTAVADHGLATGQADSFPGRHASSSAAATDAGARRETARDETVGVDGRPDPDWYTGLLVAFRQAIAEARAASQARSEGNAGSASLMATDHGLLTVTGQIDWRQRAQSANGDALGGARYDAASNISDDLLKMLPSCHFSISRASR